MHLIIANKIADQLSLKDKKAFLLGGIAPDAVAPKDRSHYFAGKIEDFTRYIAYEKFQEKYQSLNQNYILGYVTHLIADDIWLKGFYLSWLKNRMNHDEGLYQKYHGDFRLLNGKLLDHYKVKIDLLDDIDSIQLPDIDEVKAKDVREFIPYVIGDFDYNRQDLEADLNVFTFEQMVGYVETSVDKGVLYVKDQLLNAKHGETQST